MSALKWKWIGQLDHQSTFLGASVSRVTWINGSLIHCSKQKAPNKRQKRRRKEKVRTYNEEGSISFKSFLSTSLLYNIKFTLVVIHIMMKKQSTRIFIILSCWNINKIINFPSSLDYSSARRFKSLFL